VNELPIIGHLKSFFNTPFSSYHTSQVNNSYIKLKHLIPMIMINPK
jgi:aminopeptidase-like protein